MEDKKKDKEEGKIIADILQCACQKVWKSKDDLGCTQKVFGVQADSNYTSMILSNHRTMQLKYQYQTKCVNKLI